MKKPAGETPSPLPGVARINELATLGPVGDPVSFHPPSYVFRWESTKAYHGQSFMRSADDEDWYGRAAAAGSREEAGPLVPVFDEHTRWCFSELSIDVPEVSGSSTENVTFA